VGAAPGQWLGARWERKSGTLLNAHWLAFPSEKFQIKMTIFGVMKGIYPPIASLRDMVRQSRNGNTCSSHDGDQGVAPKPGAPAGATRTVRAIAV
jgi:hypothetical protein